MDLRDLLQMSDSELRATELNTIARIIGPIVGGCGEADRLGLSERVLLNHSISVLNRISLEGDTADSGALLAIKTMALGKLGNVSDAIERATEAYERSPTWHTAVAVANAYRRAGNLRCAVEMWSAAAKLDPKDVTALLEIGDTYVFLSQWASAIESYERVLEREPEQAWAIPSIHYCRFRLTGDQQALQHLQALADRSPDACGVESILAKLSGSYSSSIGTQRARDLLQQVKS